MKLRKIKLMVGLMLSASLILSGCTSKSKTADVDKVVHLRLAHALTEDHPVNQSLHKFADLVKEKTHGKVDIQIYPNGILGDETKTIELTQTGAVDIAKASASALESFAKQYSTFGIPYVFDNIDHFHKTMDDRKGIEGLYNSTEKSGFVGLTYYDAGARSFYSSKPITKPADLKGMKIRVQPSPLSVKMIKLMGGTPTPMAYGEVYTALQQKVIDGAENNEPSYTSSKQCEVAKVFSYDQHTIVPDIVIMNKKTLDKLTPEERQAVYDSAIESTEFHKKVWAEAVDKSKKEAEAIGCKFYDVDPKPFQEAVKPLVDEALKTPSVKEIYDFIKSKAK